MFLELEKQDYSDYAKAFIQVNWIILQKFCQFHRMLLRLTEFAEQSIASMRKKDRYNLKVVAKEEEITEEKSIQKCKTNLEQEKADDIEKATGKDTKGAFISRNFRYISKRS